MIRARPTRAATGPAKPSPRARWGWTALVFVVALGALWLIAGRLSPATPSTLARSSPAETAHCIRDPRCHRTFVVAHRAEGFGGPENSRAAVALVVAAGVPVIEIDLRSSEDGQLFVMHDGRLEHYTNLRGRVEETSSEEIGRARLKNDESIFRYFATRSLLETGVDFVLTGNPLSVMRKVAAAHPAR